MNSRIVKGVAGFYYVHDGNELYECKARGLFRKKGIKPLVGDYVDFEILDEEGKKGNITEIEERKNSLIRPAVANIDQALVVFAGAKPEPNLNLLDRFLVMMEVKKIPAVIVFSKSDLTDSDKMRELREIYEKYYKVLEISVKTGEGIAKLKEVLKGKFSVMAGPSGVGKSSLTNYLVPDANMETGEISRKIERGKQTTRHSELFYVGEGAYLCDTPGFGSMEVFSINKEAVKDCFPEFSEFEEGCKFLGCVHIGERECGVKDAFQKGLLSASRYENYKLIYEEIKNKKEY